MAYPASSSLLRLSPLAWEYSQNPALRFAETPKRWGLIHAAAVNLFKAIGCAFASIPEFIGLNREACNRTKAKIYLELTAMCVRAIGDYSKHMGSPLHSIEAYSRLNHLMNRKQPAIDLDATEDMIKKTDPISLHAKEMKLADDLYRNYIWCNKNEFMEYIKQRLTVEPMVTYDLSQLMPFALFMDSAYKDNDPQDKGIITEILLNCTQQLQKQGYVIVHYELWLMLFIEKTCFFPYSSAIDKALFRVDLNGVRYVDHNKVDENTFEFLAQKVIPQKPDYWVRENIVKNLSSPDLLLPLVACKEVPTVLAYLRELCAYWNEAKNRQRLLSYQLLDLDTLSAALR